MVGTGFARVNHGENPCCGNPPDWVCRTQSVICAAKLKHKKAIRMKKVCTLFGKASVMLIFAVTLQGCVPEMVMNSMDHQHYSDYVVKTEQINVQRQEAGLAPVKIMTFDQWKGSK